MSSLEKIYSGGKEGQEGPERLRIAIDEKYDLVVLRQEDSFLMPHGIVSSMVKIGMEAKKGGASFDLSAFSPREIHVFESYRFEAYELLNLVGISIDMLRSPESIFFVLHEIGHIVQANREQKRNAEEFRNNMEKRMNFQNQPEGQELTLQNERNAWAEAIRIARKIKKDGGPDLFGFFGNADGFFAWFRAVGLRSYEDAVYLSGDEGAHTKNRQIETLKEQNPERWQRRLEKSQNARETEAIEKIAKGFKENPYFENYFETS